ncbi:hypothetical protein BVX95_00615 [archaeon D22]|nr:hypothetical protein BVX95_00615 [archaeon D22]
MRMTKKYNLYINPNAITYYYKRDNLSKLYKQMFRYGFWRHKVMKHLNETNPVLFIPSLTVSYFILGLILLLTPLFKLWLIGASIYIGIILIQSLYDFVKNKEFIIYQPLVYFAIHFGYGLGMIKSFFTKFDNTIDR